LAKAVAYRSALCCLAGELRAFKAQLNAFVEGTGRNLAELIISGDTALFFARTCASSHARAFFASDSTYTDFHVITPVLILLSLAFRYYSCEGKLKAFSLSAFETIDPVAKIIFVKPGRDHNNWILAHGIDCSESFLSCSLFWLSLL
jgi:hypothetical protein